MDVVRLPIEDVKEIKYMTLEIERHAKETTIKVVGRLDCFTAPALGKMIEQSARNAPGVILELSGLELISDAGIRVLLEANEKIQPTGSLLLTSVSDNVMNTLKASGCSDVLTIH